MDAKKFTRKLFGWFVAAGLSGLFAVPVSATPAQTTQGYITYYAAGWVSPNVRVQMDFAFTNPAACTYTDGYITDSADAGAALFNTVLLSAYMAHRKVLLTIDGCAYSRPHIIGVEVMP